MQDTPSPNIEVKAYITAFIDLLGLSNRLLTLEASVLNNRSHDERIVSARDSIGTIDRFRNAFPKFYASFDEGDPARFFLDRIPELDRQLLASSHAHGTVIQRISDCVILSVPFHKDRMLATWRGLLALVAGASSAYLMLLAEGQLTRGGIDIGLSCELYPGEVLGASLVKAYGLESTVTVRPTASG